MKSSKVKTPKVLLVDEDIQFTKEVKNAQRMSSLDLTVSNDVSLGLYMMLELEFDIVVLDFDMLKSFGNDVVEFLSIVQNINHQRLVLTTRFPQEAKLAVKMLRSGIDTLISKPMNVETFCDILRDKRKRSNSNTSFFN